MPKKIVFATMTIPGAEREALLLAESIRAFGESAADAPIWWFSTGRTGELSSDLWDRLDELKVKVRSMGAMPKASTFPFAEKIFAAAKAEQLAEGQADIIVWMDSDTLMLKDPQEFDLPPDVKIACSPVHHTLIGSRFYKPPDSFWKAIYHHSRVDEDRIFPMSTVVDEVTLRPYYNAGLLVTRPEHGFFRYWRDSFQRLLRLVEFNAFFRQNTLYQVFFHQAVLAGAILNQYEHSQIKELPRSYNYPLHLHHQIGPEKRPKTIRDLVTCRYDVLLQSKDWMTSFPLNDGFKNWLKQHLP